MSDAYANVLGGGLKLKGGGIKKKKKSRPKDDGALVEASSSAATSAAPPDGASRSMTSSGANFTATEQRRMETMHKRKEDLAKKGKSHRDKVQAFNSYLTNMTEHYDLPKVSKGN